MPIKHIPLSEDSEVSGKGKKKQIDFYISEPRFTFNDIILPQKTISEVKAIIALEKNKALIYKQWGLGKVLKVQKNLSINLYGPSGTGKTMTAYAIAHEIKKKILIVNYAEIESKYVGETSKNLVELFDFADKNDAMILFDEADALLSKRVTAMHSATDVSVNQTRNVLLKILDEYTGSVVFTTNFIQNFDQAFMRRIMAHIKFEMPDQLCRQRLWNHYLVPDIPLEKEHSVLVDELSKYEDVNGSDISTAVLKAAIQAAVVEPKILTIGMLAEEIEKIKRVKEAAAGDNFTITTRKVSEDYVKEKMNSGGTINGNF